MKLKLINWLVNYVIFFILKQFCTGSTTPVTTITCRDNPSVPYCVNNQCTAVKNETDPTCEAGGSCAMNGYQPGKLILV